MTNVFAQQEFHSALQPLHFQCRVVEFKKDRLNYKYIIRSSSKQSDGENMYTMRKNCLKINLNKGVYMMYKNEELLTTKLVLIEKTYFNG